jgi:hypothetical protein
MLLRLVSDDAAGRLITRQLVDSRRLVIAAPTAVALKDFGCNSLWSKYYIVSIGPA